MLALLCFCVATEFSVNKDLYIYNPNSTVTTNHITRNPNSNREQNVVFLRGHRGMCQERRQMSGHGQAAMVSGNSLTNTAKC